jgi:hypothetical protein
VSDRIRLGPIVLGYVRPKPNIWQGQPKPKVKMTCSRNFFCCLRRPSKHTEKLQIGKVLDVSCQWSWVTENSDQYVFVSSLKSVGVDYLQNPVQAESRYFCFGRPLVTMQYTGHFS